MYTAMGKKKKKKKKSSFHIGQGAWFSDFLIMLSTEISFLSTESNVIPISCQGYLSWNKRDSDRIMKPRVRVTSCSPPGISW